MSCENPLLAVSLGVFDGKKKIKLLGRVDWNIEKAERVYGHDNVFLLPCGKCSSCKASHSREWAVRCTLESLYHKESCMVTLTYDQKYRPKKLIKRDFQQFIKDLRNAGLKIRYFGCGEYTSQGFPHFHIILFGFWPRDAKYDYQSKTGHPVYRSMFISSIWKKGIISVSEMSSGTAAYVAGYVDKKLGLGEFVLMSKKPGIGEQYFRDFLPTIYKYDNIVGSFGIAHVPRYAEKLADQVSFDISDIKEHRRAVADLNIINLIQDHGLQNKDQAAGFFASQQREKLLRKKRL